MAPATALSADIVLRHSTPIPKVPTPYEPSMLDKARAGLHTIGDALAKTGNWLIKRHRIGVTQTMGAVAAAAAGFGVYRATGDLQFYATIHEAGKPFINLDTPAENLLTAGTASAVSVMSALAVMTMKNFRREDAANLAWEASETHTEPEPVVIDVEKLGYIRPGQRLTWMDEDDIFVTEPLLSQKKAEPTEVPSPSDVDTLFSEIEEVLRENSGLHQLVPVGR